MKKLTVALLLSLGAAGIAQAETAPKNIIMVVGDGMGPAHTAAYRYFKDDPATVEIEQTVFDRHFVGRASTYPARTQGLVTDSAASGTALATGYKTYNGAIGLDNDKNPVQSVLEYAKSIGKSTGLVVTSQINHATPASYVAHVKKRKMYNEIADSYFDDKINGEFKVDLMLGGGWKYFIRKDRDIAQEFKDAGYQYIDSYDQLSQINKDQVLGLFANDGLPAALDDKQPERLKTMVTAAVDRLERNEKGYFLLIEASQIDWASHANDVASAMAEMDDLNSTVEWLEGYVANNSDTLVVVTADHNTGGMTMGAKGGGYRWEPQYLRNLSASTKTIANQQIKNGYDPEEINKQLGFELNKDEISLVKKAHAKDKKQLFKALKSVIDKRTNTGWTTSGHTGIDVPVFAFGAGKDKYAGQIDNTDIAKNIFKQLGK
ncbi:alkaline phosphatase [Photobacterium sagamiensis]|uniref:alkaline phosphatase n=1 Tax=Photobacterium sagamiensis TaxID=2910241 RepID=UPI003D0E26F9